MDTVFHENALELLMYLGMFIFISLCCNLAFFILCIKRKWNARQVSLINMFVKLIHIPAYTIIFVLGLIFSVTVFTFAISFIFIIVDCLTIFMTGLIGTSAVIRCYRENKVSKKSAKIIAFFQYIFCVDIAASIILYIRSGRKASVI